MFLSDEEMEAIEGRAVQRQAPQSTQLVHQPQQPQQIPLYPLSMANGGGMGGPGMGQDPSGQGWARKQVGGLPVWGWGLVAAGVGAAGFFFWRGRKMQVKPNPDSGSSSSSVVPAMMAQPQARSGWSPSRSRISEQLERYFQKKGHGGNVKVWHDADDAHAAGLKQVSPLVNIQVKGGGVKVDSAFTKWCRREGLNPVQHADGNIGLYPHSTKRGKEWEGYVDALRDEGQKV
jgi:hypothetical protein